jgi:hypothetical protein
MSQRLTSVLSLMLVALFFVATLAVAADSGRIQSMDPVKGTITLVEPSGQTKKVKVNNRDALSALKPGDRVTVDDQGNLKMEKLNKGE